MNRAVSLRSSGDEDSRAVDPAAGPFLEQPTTPLAVDGWRTDFMLAKDTGPRSFSLHVMNFLNEVAANYPSAISFASGRPCEQFFQLERRFGAVQHFLDRYGGRHALDRQTALNVLAQYGRTNGIINDLIAEQVANDEQIACSGDQIITTAGCQEAIALCIRVLCKDASDVVLVRSATYIGATGAAELQGVPLAPIVCDATDDLPCALQLTVQGLRAVGKTPRALYIIPDFDNPTGAVLERSVRERLLSFCAREQVVILEDNPYGMFCYQGQRLPPLAAMDRYGCTIYLGTYSKTLCPALRVGFIIVPKQLLGNETIARRLIEDISIAKSFATCNTSQLTQALVGGILIQEQGSLARIVEPALDYYRRNLRLMAQALDATLGSFRDVVRWSEPTGGFFLTVQLPFAFSHADANCCASEHEVIVTPMSFFALTDHHDRSVRLAFSNLSGREVEIGIDRFARFVKSRLER